MRLTLIAGKIGVWSEGDKRHPEFKVNPCIRTSLCRDTPTYPLHNCLPRHASSVDWCNLSRTE